MPVIESFDSRPSADLAATDYFYIRASGEATGSRDKKYSFSAIMRTLFGATTAPTARVALGIVTATGDLNFGSINAAASADLSIVVTGAAEGDAVILGLPAAPAAGIVFFAFVSAANTVTVRAMNITGSPVNPDAGTYRATVIKSA